MIFSLNSTNAFGLQFGFTLGVLVGLGIRTNVHKKTQQQLQKTCKVLLYLAHIIDQNDVPLSQFDTIVIQSLISES